MKNILDLRSVIGFFFLLVGIFLLITSFVGHPSGDKTEVVNRWSGVVYVAFGLLMLVLWKTGGTQAAEEDEL